MREKIAAGGLQKIFKSFIYLIQNEFNSQNKYFNLDIEKNSLAIT